MEVYLSIKFTDIFLPASLFIICYCAPAFLMTEVVLTAHINRCAMRHCALSVRTAARAIVWKCKTQFSTPTSVVMATQNRRIYLRDSGC